MTVCWVCRCTWPDGRVETTEWFTQDAADQMESETEQAHPGVVCEVYPEEREQAP